MVEFYFPLYLVFNVRNSKGEALIIFKLYAKHFHDRKRLIEMKWSTFLFRIIMYNFNYMSFMSLI